MKYNDTTLTLTLLPSGVYIIPVGGGGISVHLSLLVGYMLEETLLDSL